MAAQPRVYIDFLGPVPSASGKTEQWEVVAKDGGPTLGEVKWFGRWRKYAFFPAPDCVFEQDCLRVIAGFCEEKTNELRRKWRERRGA